MEFFGEGQMGPEVERGATGFLGRQKANYMALHKVVVKIEFDIAQGSTLFKVDFSEDLLQLLKALGAKFSF